MKAIIELPLKRPFELRVVEIPRMHLEHVGVNWHSGILEGDCYFHAVALRVRSEGQQWMFIKAELLENPLQAGVGVRHERIVMKAGEFRDWSAMAHKSKILIHTGAPRSGPYAPL